MAFCPKYEYSMPWSDPCYYVEKDDAGNYNIPWGSFYGSPRDIAKQIILKYLKEPEGSPRENYVGPFSLRLKPEIRCVFCQGYNSKSGVDNIELQEAISKELQTLKVLITFS